MISNNTSTSSSPICSPAANPSVFQPLSLKCLAQRALAKIDVDKWGCIDKCHVIQRFFYDRPALQKIFDQINGRKIDQLFSQQQSIDLLLHQLENTAFLSRCMQKIKPFLQVDSLTNLRNAFQTASEKVYSCFYYSTMNPFCDEDLCKWRPVVELLAKWRVTPFAISKYEKIAKVWAYLWTDVVHTLRDWGYYNDLKIEDPYLSAYVGLTPEEIQQGGIKDTVKEDSPESATSSDSDAEDNWWHKTLNHYRSGGIIRKISPLLFVISFSSRKDQFPNPQVYQLLYKYGERPWGHELSGWIEDFRYPSRHVPFDQIEPVTKLLCETGCVAALCENRLSRRTYSLTWHYLCQCPLVVLTTVLQYYPENYFELLECPKNLLYSMLSQASETGTLAHLEYVIKYYKEHGLWTQSACERAATCTDDPEKKALLQFDEKI